jgi:hypothetical protein
MLGVASIRVESDLKRFKEFIESKGGETGLGVVKSDGRLESFEVRTRYVGAIRLPPIAGHLYRVRVTTDQRRLVCPK